MSSTRPDDQGPDVPAANQQKTEPEPTTPHEADPTAPPEAPDLGDINVGGADPQAPSHPATGTSRAPGGLGAAGAGDPAGVAVPPSDAAPGTSERLPAID
jgi:hypothetical protein